MPFETDQRLKSYLNTNQLARERLCLAILSVDRRFSNVKPRHPHGGPDGGIDIDATYVTNQQAAGAVGFVIEANDSPKQKNAIRKKFKQDVVSAKSCEPSVQIFVFFTNINLTMVEKKSLRDIATEADFADCEIYDREKIRLVLDSVDGFAARIQYLGVPLTEEEQATFFARWGDDIQSVISTGFQRIERTLDRLLFLQEAEEALTTLHLKYELDRTYDPDEIGHLRVFCYLTLREPKQGIIGAFFGVADGSNRFYNEKVPPKAGRIGFRYGIGGGQWEWRYDENKSNDAEKEQLKVTTDDDSERWTEAGCSSSGGTEKLENIFIQYVHSSDFLRYRPSLTLRDFDGAHFIHLVNESIASKIRSIEVIGNGYRLAKYEHEFLVLDRSQWESKLPAKFTEEEMRDPWVRIRDRRSSMHSLDFFSYTPKRLYDSTKLG